MEKSILLEDISVVKHCPASWKHMAGDDQVRHCTHCNRNVYNLSNMTRHEANRVIQSAGEGMCVRFYRRKRDGMIMTRDCGRAAATKRRVSGLFGVVFAFLGFSFALPATTMGAAAATPKSRVRSCLRMIDGVDRDLAATNDKIEREELLEMRSFELERLRKIVKEEGLTPIIDNLTIRADKRGR